ncbi:MAG: lysophospholipid acyltransferase family protein [Pseudomonadota bacterium]|nr:lysophospholipid acyltransferase family protein [Pseudomonadota bacterium]
MMRAEVIKLVLRMLALLPLPLTHALATVIGRMLARYYPQGRLIQVVQKNIQLCFPNLSESQKIRLIEDNLIETCKTFIELGALWLWPLKRVLNLIRVIQGEHYLQQAYQQGKGVILLTPHLGAWELAGLYASVHYPLTALYRPPKLKGLQQLIHRARQRGGGRFMPTDHTGVRALYHALRRGQIAGILPDQVPQTGLGIFAPFLGMPAYTLILVSRLAHKTQAPVILTYAQRLPRGQGFHLHFLPAPANIQVPQLDIAVRALNQGIEQCIDQCPSQYQWSYKRFKKQPEGECSVYD